MHLVESCASGSNDCNGNEQFDFSYKLWDGPLLVAGGYAPHETRELIEGKYPGKDILVMFGGYVIANPDLVFKIRRRIRLCAYDGNTFYVTESPGGYVDYAFCDEFLAGGRERSC